MKFIDDVPSDIDGIVLFKNKVVEGKDMLQMHSHSYHELYFLLSGERRYFVGHEIYDVEPGNIVLIPNDTLHRTTSPARKGYERYVLYFNEKDIKNLVSSIGKDLFEKFLKMGCVTVPDEQSSVIKRCFEELEREVTTNDFLTKSVMQNILEQIILTVIRYGEKKHKEKREGEDRTNCAIHNRELQKRNNTFGCRRDGIYGGNLLLEKIQKADGLRLQRVYYIYENQGCSETAMANRYLGDGSLRSMRIFKQ